MTQDGASGCGLPFVFPFVLFLSFVTKNADSVLVYDRQALFNIRFATEKLLKYDLGGSYREYLLASAAFRFHLPGAGVVDGGANAAVCW